MSQKKILIFRLLCQAILFLIFVSSYAQADEVILRNGDILTGKIIGIKEGVLTLETSYSEPIQLNYESVQQMNSSDPVEIHLKEGEILKGKITTNSKGQLVVNAGSGREAVALEFKNIAALNPPPKKPVTWKGNVTLGGNVQSGNSDTMNVSAGGMAVRKTEYDRFLLNLLYNRTEDSGQRTAESTFGQLKYDYLLNPEWYLYLNIDMLSDEFKDIKFRTNVGPGIGYQIWDEENKALSLEAGVSYTSEDRDLGEDNAWVSARLGVNFLKKLFDRILFTDQAVIYPSLEDSGEYTLRNEASLITDIGARLSFKLSNIWERNSNPEPGQEQDDFIWILGLQYSFSNL